MHHTEWVAIGRDERAAAPAAAAMLGTLGRGETSVQGVEQFRGIRFSVVSDHVQMSKDR